MLKESQGPRRRDRSLAPPTRGLDVVATGHHLKALSPQFHNPPPRQAKQNIPEEINKFSTWSQPVTYDHG